jgi:hypothetical protein
VALALPPAHREGAVEDVVDGDGAEQAATLVADGHGHEVVRGQPLGDLTVGQVRA